MTGDAFMRKTTILNMMIAVLSVVLCIVLCSCSSNDYNNTEKDTLKPDPTDVSPTTQETSSGHLETEVQVSETVKDESWKQIYLNCLNGNDDEYFEFALVYVNEDDIPELYKHGKKRPSSSELCWIFENEVYSQAMFIDGFEYYEKGNLFMSTGVQSGIQGDFVYQINDSEATKLSQGTASRVIQGQERFTWNGEDVTEEEYEALRNAAFDSTNATTVNEYYTISDLLK